jgi:hypothetical protein
LRRRDADEREIVEDKYVNMRHGCVWRQKPCGGRRARLAHEIHIQEWKWANERLGSGGVYKCPDVGTSERATR